MLKKFIPHRPAGRGIKQSHHPVVVMLLIGASSCMSWIMTMANIPQTVSATLLGLSDNPIVILLTINMLLLFVGTFMQKASQYDPKQD